VFYGPLELRAGWRLLIYAALLTTFFDAGNRAVHRLLPGADDTALEIIRQVMGVLVYLAASGIMAGIEGRTIADYGLPWRQLFGARFWQGVLLGFASLTGLMIGLRAAGVLEFGSVELHGVQIGLWAGAYALFFLFVGVREELRYRGYGLYTLAAGVGFWPAAVLSAGYFAFIHSGNRGETWTGLLNVFAVGLLLCFLIRRTGNLWLAIGFHAAFDWGETYFYGVSNSGAPPPPGHLMASTSSGVAWLSGGTVGPEGSVFCTLMIVVVWLLCAGWLREVKYPNFARPGDAPPASTPLSDKPGTSPESNPPAALP
jgi:membrane protease YdiL (CAAX protease family)